MKAAPPAGRSATDTLVRFARRSVSKCEPEPLTILHNVIKARCNTGFRVEGLG